MPLPKVLILENVADLVGIRFIKDFQKWEDRLTQFGYVNHIQVINAKDYGIPQNRKRVFCVSVLNDNYEFAPKIELKYRLKDFLEHNVSEKYYLSKKMIEYISADNEKWTGNNNNSLVNRDIGCCLNTAPGQKRCDASNYICDDLPENADLKQYNNKALNETLENNEIEDGDFIDAYNRDVKKDVSGTILTGISSRNMHFVAEKINEIVEEKGELPEMFNPYNKQEIKGISPTLTAQCGSTTSSSAILIKETENDGGG